MGGVQGATEDGPETQDAAATRRGQVEAGDAHKGVVHAVEHARAGAEVVELLGGPEVARMEDGAEDPGGHVEVGEQFVVPPHRVARGHALTQPRQPRLVREEVAQAEDDRERLLHAENPHEGPFPVELGDGPAGLEAARCGDVLAGVVAFLGAGPEQEAVVESCIGARNSLLAF